MSRLPLLFLRELWMNQRFTTLFILNLSLGLSGFVALNSFKMSMESSLQTRSRIILGADFGLSARHPLSVKTRQLVDSSFSSPAFVSETIELYSMVSSSKKKSFLVQVKAIDAQFPLYGSIKVSGSPLEQSTVSLAISKRSTQPLAWIYPEILSQLEVTVGDYLKVGEAQFKIAGIIVDDPSAGIGTTMAPRIYISLTDIPSTKLINEESIVRYSLLYALPKLKESQLEEMEKSLYLHPLMPQDVEVYSHRTAGEELGRLIDYLGDYLSLVSLSALFLCSLGAIFLFRSYFSSKIHQMAILLSLGLSPLRLMVLLLWQMGILGFLASVPAIGLSLILVPFISLITQHLLPIHLETPIEGSAMVVAMVISTLGGMLVCFPTVLGVKNIKPTSLFRLRYQEPVPGKFFRTLLAYFPAIFSFWLLSVWQSHSWQVGSLFILLLAIAGSFLWAFGFFVLKWLQHRVPQGSPFLTLALRDLTRHYYPTLTIFLALGLGIVLLNIVPQIQANLHGEMVQPEKSQLPSFFLFDIQEEQVADLKKLLSEAQVRLEQLAPLVRARLMEVNGKIFEKKKSKNFSREEEREARFRNRGFNLTYRAKLSNSEQLDSGAEFAGSYDPSKGKLPGISVEKRFANRLGLKIGDILTFDIQDVSVKGEIVNFRTVRWTSFNPNFFIQFQPGVLETAPKTYLASISRLDTLTGNQIQNEIVTQFPNISLVNVSRLVNRLLEITRQMGWALQFMAIMNILVGSIVLFSVANYRLRQRNWEVSLLKVLGSSSRQIRNMFWLQFLLISTIASVVGVLISLGVSAVISSLLFDQLWIWQWETPILSILLLALIIILVVYFSIRKLLFSRPNSLLRQVIS